MCHPSFKLNGMLNVILVQCAACWHMAASYGQRRPASDYFEGSRRRSLPEALLDGEPVCVAIWREEGPVWLPSQPWFAVRTALSCQDDSLEGAPAIGLSGPLRRVDPEAMTHRKALFWDKGNKMETTITGML